MLHFEVHRALEDRTGLSHLNRMKIVCDDGWITVPDPKHIDNVLNIMGISASNAGKYLETPSVKRVAATDGELTPLDDGQKTKFRSAVGSLIYLSMDREDIIFVVKELARRLHTPRHRGWKDLIRLTK